jgi:hypothetical protein
MYEKVKLLSLILDMDRRGHSSEEVPCTKAARQIIMSTILVVRGDHITHQYSTLIWEEDTTTEVSFGGGLNWRGSSTSNWGGSSMSQEYPNRL